jgi:hypothetical protein
MSSDLNVPGRAGYLVMGCNISSTACSLADESFTSILQLHAVLLRHNAIWRVAKETHARQFEQVNSHCHAANRQDNNCSNGSELCLMSIFEKTTSFGMSSGRGSERH